MQVVPMTSAASASLTALPAAQAEPGSLPEAFGQLLLHLLTGVTVSADTSVAVEGDEGQTEDTETGKEPSDTGQTADSAALLAGLGAIMAQYMATAEVQTADSSSEVPSTEPDLAAQSAIAQTLALAEQFGVTGADAESAVATGIATLFAAGLESATETVAGEEPAATADTETPTMAALGLADLNAEDVAAASVTVASAAADGETATRQDRATVADSRDVGQPVATQNVQPVSDLAGFSMLANDENTLTEGAIAVAEGTPEVVAEGGHGEAYARVAAAKRFATTTTTTTGTDASAAVAATGVAVTPEQVAETTAEAVDSGIRTTELLDRIAGQIRVTAEAGGGEATLQLQPESLGRLEISVKVVDGQVSVSLSADSSAVQHVLADRLPDLVSALAASGMTVAQANVDIGDRAHRQQSWAQETTYVGSEAEEDTPEASSPVDWLQPLSILDLHA